MKKMSIVLYLGIALGIMLPLFQPGYLFFIDMVYGPRIDLSDSLLKGMHVGIPLIALQSALSSILPSDIVQKIVLTFALFLPGYGMYILTRNRMSSGYAMGAGLLYQLNPYVFERFVSGQWHVLLGYGFFPIVIYFFLEGLKQKNLRSTLIFSIVFSVYPWLSLHWAAIAGEFIIILGILEIIRTRKMKQKIYWGFKDTEIFAFVFFVFNAFWLWSMFVSPEYSLTQFTTDEFKAFTTLGDPKRGIWLNVLNLYGFWNTEFMLPKDLFGLWWLLGPALVVFSVAGARAYWKQKKDVLAIAAVLIFPVALIFSMGYATPLSEQFVYAIRMAIPIMGGLRETAKVIGFLAFCYAFLAPMGFQALAKKLGRNEGITLLFILPFLMAGPLLWGAMGQIQPAYYPSEWEEVENLITEEDTMLVLPWLQYMRLNFAGNALAANPARTYFSSDVIIGSYTDNPYLDYVEQSDLNDTVTELVHEVTTLTEQKEYLQTMGITHLLLLKTDDWEAYEPMLKDPSIEKIYKGDTIELYSLTEQQPQ